MIAADQLPSEQVVVGGTAFGPQHSRVGSSQLLQVSAGFSMNGASGIAVAAQARRTSVVALIIVSVD